MKSIEFQEGVKTAIGIMLRMIDTYEQAADAIHDETGLIERWQCDIARQLREKAAMGYVAVNRMRKELE